MSHPKNLNPDMSLSKLALLLSVAIGVIQGSAGWWIGEHWIASGASANGIFSDKVFLVALFNFFILGGLCAQALLKASFGKFEIVISISAGLLFALLCYWSLTQLQVDTVSGGQYLNKGGAYIELSTFSLLLAYILFPYMQAWKTRKDGIYQYSDLFRHSWDNIFIAGVGVLVTAVYWLLIFLWVYLFKIVKIDIFENIFFDKLFVWISTFGVFGLGITVGINNDKVIGALRSIALSICKWLMPLASIITVLFTITLLFVGLQPIWDTNHSTPIIVVLIAINIFFINGIVQDGTSVDYPFIPRILANISFLLMPVLAVIAMYSTWIRIDQYGLTPLRLYSALIVMVILFYCFVYALAVVRRGEQWMENIRKPNFYMGLLICSLIVATHSPVLDPYNLTAKNQFFRLMNNDADIDNFDFGALKYKYGKAGERYLRNIRELKDHPNLDEIKSRLVSLDDTDSYYTWHSTYLVKRRSISDNEIVILNNIKNTNGVDRSVPSAFLNRINSYDCVYKCYILFVDTNGNGSEEIIKFESVYPEGAADVFALKGNEWVVVGSYELTSLLKDGKLNIELLYEIGSVQLYNPEYKNMSIGQVSWEFHSLR